MRFVNYLLVIIFLSLTLIGKGQDLTVTKKMADVMRDYFLMHVKDIQRADTIFAMGNKITPSFIKSMQFTDYRLAEQEADSSGNRQLGSYYNSRCRAIADSIEFFDTTEVFGYYIKADAIIKVKNMPLQNANKVFCMTRDLKIVTPDYFIQRVAQTKRPEIVFAPYHYSPPPKNAYVNSYIQKKNIVKFTY